MRVTMQDDRQQFVADCSNGRAYASVASVCLYGIYYG